MRTLQAQGLVEVSQGRRPRVRPADPQTAIESLQTFLQRGEHSLLQLLEVRRPLETEIAALAARRASDSHIALMEEANRELAKAQTLEEQVAADMRFHDLLAEATGNLVFPLLLTALAGLMRQSRQRTIARVGTERALIGHRAVLAAVKSHDPGRARTAMIEHLRMAEEDLRDPGSPVSPDTGRGTAPGQQDE
jgi:GntR family transcriptional repressor for pyruvate dehydrogenase complex